MTRSLPIAILFCLLFATLADAQTRPVHAVRSGETLFSISRQHNVSVEQIRTWNNLTSNTISTGQRLWVGPASETSPGSPLTHRVRPGETLFSISRRYGVTVGEISDWNRLDGAVIETGQILEIRRTTMNVQTESVSADTSRAIVTEVLPSAYHVVQRGEALGVIAQEYGLTLSDIRELNKLRRDLLSPGQVLLIRKPEAVPAVAPEQSRSGPQGRYVRHTWTRGDQLSNVLSRYAMSETELAALNPDFDLRNLQPGAELVVLLPPTAVYANPYRATRQDPMVLGTFPATVYADADLGKRLTSGELYSPDLLTAGHNSLPLGSIVYVEDLRTGVGVYIQINDRILEPEFRLSRAGWSALGLQAGPNHTVRVSRLE
jgi:LysM repeat protein